GIAPGLKLAAVRADDGLEREQEERSMADSGRWQQAEAHPHIEADDLGEVNAPGEVNEVLAVLCDLLGRVRNPVVRACLEEAHDDILHLTGWDEPRGERRAA